MTQQRQNKTIRLRILTALTAAAFLFVGLTTIDMAMHHSVGVGCSIQSAPQTCVMGVGEHLAWWNSTFTATVEGNSTLSLLALIAALLAGGVVFALLKERLGYKPALFIGAKDPPDDSERDYFSLFLAAGKARPLLYA